MERKIIVCDKCSHEFFLDSVKINEAKVDCNGNQLRLAYFTCPKCNQIYRVLLKDARYEELVQDLENCKSKMRKAYKFHNASFAQTLSEMATTKKDRLKNYSAKLQEQYPGTFTYMASENNHEDLKIVYLP